MASRTSAAKALFDTASLGAPENAIGFVLWRLVHRYQRDLDRALAPMALTHLQFQTLALSAWLGRDGEPVTQTQLARAGDIQPMQVSHMLKALEQKGFIERSVDDADTRSKRVQVTGAGLKALRLAFPRAIEVQREIFGDQGRPGGTLLTTMLALLAQGGSG